MKKENTTFYNTICISNSTQLVETLKNVVCHFLWLFLISPC